MGLAPATDQDVEIKTATDAVYNSGMSQEYVVGRVNDMISGALPLYQGRATKTYVDNQDSLYATADYYPAQDALLIPTASLGAIGGTATLNGSGIVPTGQLPSGGGVGIIKGPYGMTKQYDATTTSTPVKIGEWVYPVMNGTNFGAVGCTSQLLVFANTNAVSLLGRPVVEVRAGTATQTTYAAQKRVAIGYGRSMFNDYQSITLLPSWTGSSNPAWSAGTVITVMMWMYDDTGGTVSTVSGATASAVLYLARTAL